MAKLARRLLDGLTLAALTVLPLIVFLHVYYLQRELELSADQNVALLSDSELSKGMSQLLSEISATNPVSGSSDPSHSAHRIPIRPAFRTALLSGATQLSSYWADPCIPSYSYGRTPISLSCASLIPPPGASPKRLARAAFLAAQLDLGAKLEELYLRSQRNLQTTSARSVRGSSRPPIPFFYVLMESDAASFVIIYPGVELEPTFDYRSRPWYSASKPVGAFLTSHIYHDYTTNDFVVSLAKETKNEHGRTRVLADYRVQPSGTLMDLFLLNALIATIAFTAYLRLYIRSRFRFEKYLVLSTGLLILHYLALVANQITILSRLEAFPSDRSLNYYLAFLPAGSLLAVAATCLRYKHRSALKSFLYWYFAEFATAAVSYSEREAFFSAAFSCSCLVYFGLSLWRASSSFSATQASDLPTSPRYSARYSSLAYLLWGFAQFSILFLGRESSRVFPYLAPIFLRWPAGDLLFSDVGSYIVLLYAKAVSIFFTVSFLYSLEIGQLRERFGKRDPIPAFRLNENGVIVDLTDFPFDVGIVRGKTDLAALLPDAEDRVEFGFALRHDLELSSYVCRLPTIFPDSLLRLHLENPSMKATSRRLSISRFDESRLLKRLDKHISEHLVSFLDALNEKTSGVAAFRADGTESESREQAFRELQVFLSGAGRRVAETSRRELLELKEQHLLRSLKVGVTEAWTILREEIIRFDRAAYSAKTLTLETETPAFASFPRTLRVGSEIWRLVVTSLLSEIDASYQNTEASLLATFAFLQMPPVTPIQGDGFVSLRCDLPASARMATATSRMRLGHLPIGSHLSALEPPGGNLYLAYSILELFGGELASWSEGDRLILEIKLRPLFSTGEV